MYRQNISKQNTKYKSFIDVPLPRLAKIISYFALENEANIILLFRESGWGWGSDFILAITSIGGIGQKPGKNNQIKQPIKVISFVVFSYTNQT